MARFTLVRAAVLVLGLVALAPAAASAQEITESHLAAAREAVSTAKVAHSFDALLPTLSSQVQNRLIRVRPDLHKEISDVVDKVALSMAARRAELNNDIARIWARAFTEAELKQITAFYKSAAGAKLADISIQVLSDGMQAAKQWSDRIGEELLEKSRAELKTQGLDF